MFRTQRFFSATATLIAWLLAEAAAAQSGAPPKSLSQEWADDPPAVEERCETYNERYAMAPLFRVVAGQPGERVHFFSRKQPCAEGAPCPHRRQSYLVAGDVVFGGPEDRGFRCVYFGTRRGQMVAGFVGTKNLTPIAAETKLDRAFLLGAWRRDEASGIRIRPRGAAGIEVDGDGFWKSAASVNVGEFHAKADAIASPVLVLEEEKDGCTVVLERRGPYLLVNDNARCGGHNVRFVGIYIRQAAR
jgi:hypothetical protein